MSDAPFATSPCCPNVGAAAMNTPRRSTWRTDLSGNHQKIFVAREVHIVGGWRAQGRHGVAKFG